jgi:hypothetical protein
VLSKGNTIVVTDKIRCNSVTIPQPVTKILQINSPGPVGPPGPSGSGGGVGSITGSNATSSFTASSTWTFNHNLGSQFVVVQTFDTNYNEIIPQNIQLTNSSSATITFPVNKSGFAIASLGGSSNIATTSSYALTASYVLNAISASYVLQAKNAISASYVLQAQNAITASYALIAQNARTASYVSQAQTAITASYALTASYTLNAQSASFTPNALTTASVSLNTITFTKGDGSTFPITVNTGSGGGGVTFPYTGSAIITGSLVVTGSIISTLGFTGSLQGTASWANNAISSSYPIAVTGSTLRSVSPAGGENGASTNNSIFLGSESGRSATNAYYSNFIGADAGSQATNAYYSNFIGASAGTSATSASFSNFIGRSAGELATKANDSVFIGTGAGLVADSSSYSVFLGYKAGGRPSLISLPIGNNNIIIGTNITLSPSRKDSINIGGIIFGTGSYSTITSLEENAFSGSTNGKIGINVITPTRNFEVSGSVAFNNLTNALYPNVLSVDTATGQLYYQSATSGSGGGSVIVAYTGSTVDFAATTLNFTGSGVKVTGGAGTSTIEIPGGGLSGGTTGYIPVFTSATSVTSSYINQDNVTETVTITKHLEVYSGSIVPYYTVTGISLGLTQYDITSSGIFEIVNADGNITFPNPSTHDGQAIFVVNTDVDTAITVDNSNTYAPYNAGTNTQLSTIGIDEMFHFVSIGGKWRGIKSGK